MNQQQIRQYLQPYKYQRPPDYIGETYPEHYAIAGIHRDSDTVDRSNWHTWMQLIEPYDTGHDDSPATVHRARHWAVGWAEELMIRQDAPAALLEEVAETLQALERYPVLDDDHRCELEYEELMTALEDYGYREIAEDNGVEYYDLTDADQEKVKEAIHDAAQYGSGEELSHDGNGPTWDSGFFEEALAPWREEDATMSPYTVRRYEEGEEIDGYWVAEQDTYALLRDGEIVRGRLGNPYIYDTEEEAQRMRDRKERNP